MKSIQHILLILLFLPVFGFSQENPLEGKKLKDLKIEIKLKDGNEMNVDSKFSIWTTVTIENGKPLKGFVREGADLATYDVKVSGAKKNKYNPLIYNPNKFCEGYKNKELTITVSAKGINTITKTLKFNMNCTPDPAIVALKEKEKEKELKRVVEENTKAKIAKEKLDAEKAAIAELAAAGKLVGLTISESTISSLTLKHDKFKHYNTVKIDNEFLLLGSTEVDDGSGKTMPAIYKLKDNNLEMLIVDIGDFPLLEKTAIRDLVKISKTEVVASTDNGYIKMEKTSTGYKENLHLHSPDDYPLSFTRIVSIGDGKCASIGYPREVLHGKINYAGEYNNSVSYNDYQSNDEYKEYRDKGMTIDEYKLKDNRHDAPAYLVIWDYNSNDFAFLNIGNNICEESILACDNSGNLIYSLSRESRLFLPAIQKNWEDYFHKATENLICSIDIAKSFEGKELEYNWCRDIETDDLIVSNSSLQDRKFTFLVTDIIIEDNDDVVFTAISVRDSLYYINRSLYSINSSTISLGRLDSNGGVKNWHFNSGLNVSLWGGSSKGDLKLKNNPGKIYYSEFEFPKLLESPDGKGYIMTATVGRDEVTYPNGSKQAISSSFPLFVYIDKEKLEPISFDFINKGAYYADDEILFYNANSKKYSFIKNYYNSYKPSIQLEFELNYSKNWKRRPRIKEYKAGENVLEEYQATQYHDDIVEDYNSSDNESTNSSSDSYSNSNTSSSSSSNSKSSEPELKTVQVYVDPKSKGTVKVYWKENGSSKKFTLTGSRRAIGYLLEGTKLSYSIGPNHNKKTYFYTVPSGKSSVSVNL